MKELIEKKEINFNNVFKSDLTDEEKYNFITKKLEEGYANVYSSSSDYQKYLSSFRNNMKYSATNHLLLFVQKPDFLVVKTFKEWKSEGINVEKGEKGLKIRIPLKTEYFYSEKNLKYKQVKKATTEEKILIENGKIKKFEKTRFVIKGMVFDISQTNANPEQIKKITNLNLNSEKENKKIYMEVKNVVAREVRILEENPRKNGVQGSYDSNLNLITIRPNLSQQQKVNVLLHEYGHFLLHNKNEMKINPATGVVKEVQAETFSYLLSRELGTNIEQKSLEYIHKHLIHIPPNARGKIFKNVLSKVHITKDKIRQSQIELKNEKIISNSLSTTHDPQKESDKGLHKNTEKNPKKKKIDINLER